MHHNHLQVGDFNYRVDPPPGFRFSEITEDNTANDQLYAFVHEKVGLLQRKYGLDRVGLQLFRVIK